MPTGGMFLVSIVYEFYNNHAAAMPHRTTQDIIWASDLWVSLLHE
jgi:hypothetical protein